jgi:quercetin dioxygenase-like cupin family protein
MLTAHCDELELIEASVDENATERGRFDVPISAETGAADSAVIYFEVDPGHSAIRHTHSAEEILYVRAGTAEVEVGDERERVTAGGLVVIPAFAPHNVHTVGDETGKFVGFFSASAVVTKLERTLQPLGIDLLVMGAPVPEPAKQPG